MQLNQSDSLGFNQWLNLHAISGQMAERSTHLVVQLPRQVALRCAPLLENGPEVDLDELPLRSMTEVAKYSTQRSKKKKNWYVGQIQDEICGKKAITPLIITH